MTTRVGYHADTASEFLSKSHTYLTGGDLLQASEKGWGATARMVKAVAETRGWRHSTHGDLHRTVNRLAEESPDQQLRSLFLSANALDQNSYEGWMTEEDVAVGLRAVEEIVGRLQAVID